MKKSMLILTLMVAALCGCAAQQPTTLETPETSVMVEVTPETSSGATPTATPAPTPDPTPVPTAEPTATPTPTAAPTAKPTPAPTEAPAATAAPVQQAEASQQVSMSYDAVPFDLAAGTDQWWSIDRFSLLGGSGKYQRHARRGWSACADRRWWLKFYCKLPL